MTGTILDSLFLQIFEYYKFAINICFELDQISNMDEFLVTFDIPSIFLVEEESKPSIPSNNVNILAS